MSIAQYMLIHNFLYNFWRALKLFFFLSSLAALFLEIFALPVFLRLYNLKVAMGPEILLIQVNLLVLTLLIVKLLIVTRHFFLVVTRFTSVLPWLSFLCGVHQTLSYKNDTGNTLRYNCITNVTHSAIYSPLN